MTDKKDFREYLTVDKYNLDEEWENQPNNFMDACEWYADSVMERDKCKEQLELLRAQVGKDIQDNPSEFGIDKDPGKVTVDALNKAINLDKKVRSKQEELHEKNRQVNIMSGAKEALAHKKKAIESLTELTIWGYFAEPKVNKKTRDKSLEKASETNQEALSSNSRLSRRRKKT